MGDTRRMMENVYQLLEEGGEALLLFIASNPLFRMYRKLGVTKKWSPYMKDLESYIPVYQDSKNSSEEFAKVLTSIGFKIRLCQVNEHSYVYRSEKQVLNAVRAVNPFICRIPENPSEALPD